MKFLPLLLFLPALAAAQETLPDPATVRFTPPAPPKEVPPLVVEDASVLHTPTHEITVLRADASTLPDVPPAPAPARREGRFIVPLETPARPVTISGEAYGPALSRIEIIPPGGKARVIWCGWDVSLLTELHEFEHEGLRYEIRFLPGVMKEIPENAPAPAARTSTAGDQKTASLLDALRGFRQQHLTRLKALRAARKQAAADAAAWQAAHPPVPQDHTIWLKPHRGSRCLAKDEQKEETAR